MLIFSGFDPSSGAGLLQDFTITKMFGIKAKSIISAYTLQTENEFKKVNFNENLEEFKLFKNFNTIKVGMANSNQLKILRSTYKNAKIIWNPILKTSTNYEILSKEEVIEGSKYVDLLIMNSNEAKETGIKENLIITGGHLNENEIIVTYNKKKFYSKKYDKTLHGTGCVFSTLIASHIHLGYTFEEAIKASLKYIDMFIKNSNSYVETEDYIIQWHRKYIIDALWGVKNDINLLGKYTIPEVGQNIVYALPNATEQDHVGKFPGRIHKLGNEVNFIHEPAFFGTSHMARAVIATMKYFPWIRAAMNITYNHEFIKKAEKKGYSVYHLDRYKEPEELRKIEGASIPYGLSDIYNETNKPVDFVWDEGFPGKEAMIRVFGVDPKDIINKVKDVVLND